MCRRRQVVGDKKFTESLAECPVAIAACVVRSHLGGAGRDSGLVLEARILHQDVAELPGSGRKGATWPPRLDAAIARRETRSHDNGELPFATQIGKDGVRRLGLVAHRFPKRLTRQAVKRRPATVSLQ